MPPNVANRPYRALRHRDFRRLWLASLVSVAGTQMQLVAIDWHVYVLTRSPLALGLMGLVRVVPVVVFSLWGGIVADRWNRRWVTGSTQAFMAAVAVALAAVTWTGKDSVALIYVLTAATAATTAFDNPARNALIPRLVPRQELPGALALNLTMFHAAMIGGPAMAGILIAGAAGTTAAAVGASTTHGLALIYLLNAVSFVGVIGAIATLRTSGRVETDVAASHPIEALRDGLHFVFSTPIMVWTMSLDFFATFFAGANVLLPIFAVEILHAGPTGYGWLRSAAALGALAGSIATTLRPLPERQGHVLLFSVAAFGAATVVFGLSRSYPVTFAALFVVGLADLVSTVVRQTLRQVVTPDALRGRMTSVNMVFYMGGPQLGELEAGLVAWLFRSAALGAVVSVVSGGVFTLGVAAVVALAAPAVRRYDVREHLRGPG
ncbi:MAG: MFS transporter [Acidobacteriia bacterium]|nr:MFS transporter [Terriglobia bacterium]